MPATTTPIATSEAVENLREEIEADMVMHQLAFAHFGSRHFWFFVIPQALLTLINGILAFLATSSVVKGSVGSDPETADAPSATPTSATPTSASPDDQQDRRRLSTTPITGDVFAIIVGCISALVVFLQTVASNRKYEEKATMHDGMATNLGGLKLHLKNLETKLNAQANQGGGESHIAVHDNTFEFIATQMKEFDTGCKSRVPFRITAAFNALDSKLKQHLFDEDQPNQKYRYQIRFRAYDILSTQIMSHWSYPLFLPNAVKMVDQTMYLLVQDLNEKQRNLVQSLSYYQKALAYRATMFSQITQTESSSKRDASKEMDEQPPDLES